MHKHIQKGYDYISKKGHTKLNKQRQSTIEINGKLYDTKSGALLKEQPSHQPTVPAQRINDFATPKPQTIFTPEKPDLLKLSRKRPTPQRSQASHLKRTTQKSVILMRKSVKRPATGIKTNELSTKDSSERMHTTQHRANQISQSPFISRHGMPTSRIVKKTEHIAVALHPEQTTRHKHTQPNPPHHKSKPTIHHKHRSKAEQIFSNALEKAEPQKTKPIKSRKSRPALRWSSGLLALILLTGFIGYMNLPNINVKFAGVKAGFSASLPKNGPSGFSINGPVNYDNGKVVINFRSNTDGRSYSIKQEVSNWNSSSLQENFLVANNKTFTTTQDKGRTVYIYDNNATWVNRGVWYNVESTSLSSDQLLSIATSI